jgi:membrane protease subunit HflK
MPWNNNTGGGGWKGGGGGPWGSGPQQRGPQPPDLEELLRRSQDRLRTALPGGGRTNYAILGALALALLAIVWVFQSFYQVQPNELGQELVFGDPKDEVSTPGLHFIFWPVETVEIVSTRQTRERIAYDDAARRNGTDSNLMLSADQNIVEIDFTVLWKVSDPKQFIFNVNDPVAMLRRMSESAMRELVGRSSAEEVRTERRAEVEEGVRALVQATLIDYGAGITIDGVQLERADPPAEVADAFEEVQRAQQDLERFQREAEQYGNKRLGDARGQAAQISEQAIGYRQQVVAEAQGESQRFVSVLAEYEQAEEVTRERLFLETMERVLGDSNKIILEQTGGQGVLPYLPLDQLQRNAAPPVAQQPIQPQPQAQTPGTQSAAPRPQAQGAAQ